MQEITLEVLVAGKDPENHRYAVIFRFEGAGDDFVGYPAPTLVRRPCRTS